MDELSAEARTAELDAWLREHLERRLVAAGLTLTLAGDGTTGEPPAPWLAGLAAYGEVRARWIPAGIALADGLRRAAEQDPDVLLCWMEAADTTEVTEVTEAGDTATATATGEDVEEHAHAMLARLVAHADDLGLRERCVIAVVGPAVTQARARRAGCDAGFAPVTPLAQVMAALARDVAGREAFRRGGSSPPCYL